MKALNELSFRFKEKSDAAGYVSGLARRMQVERDDKADLLAPPSRLAWNGTLARRVLRLLTPANAIVMLSSRDFLDEHRTEDSAFPVLDLAEPVYSTKYATRAMTPDEQRLWASDGGAPGEAAALFPRLGLPAANPYIPSNFTVLPPAPGDEANAALGTAHGDVAPALLVDDDGGSDRVGDAYALPLRLWHRRDTGRFPVPKVSLRCDVRAPAVYASPRHAALFALFADLADDALNERAYMAGLAGSGYSFGTSALRDGVALSFGGYSDWPALRAFAEEVLGVVLLSPATAAQTAAATAAEGESGSGSVFTEARFAVMKEMRLKAYANFDKEQPYRHAMYHAARVLQRSKFAVADVKAEAEKATLKDVVAFAKKDVLVALTGNDVTDGASDGAAGKREGMRCLVHGNADAATATAMATFLRKRLRAAGNFHAFQYGAGPQAAGDEAAAGDAAKEAAREQRDAAQRAAVVRLPGARDGRPLSHAVFARGLNAEDVNSAVHVTFQVGRRVVPAGAEEWWQAGQAAETKGQRAADAQQRLRRSVLLDLLGTAIHTPCYDTLRTKEQLGYMVWCFPSSTYGVRTLNVVVQSSARDAAYVAARAGAFLRAFRADTLARMDPAAFDGFVTVLRAQYAKKDERLSSATGRLWGEIASRELSFGRRARQLALLAGVAKSDLLEFYDTYVLAPPAGEAQAHRQPDAGGDDASATASRRRLVVEVFGKGREMPSTEEARQAAAALAKDELVDVIDMAKVAEWQGAQTDNFPTAG